MVTISRRFSRPRKYSGRVIRLTLKGQQLQETIYAEAGAAQQRIAEILVGVP